MGSPFGLFRMVVILSIPDQRTDWKQSASEGQLPVLVFGYHNFDTPALPWDYQHNTFKVAILYVLAFSSA